MAAIRVDAGAGSTQARRLETLVHVDTHLLVVVQLVAGLTGAHEAAESVGAAAVLTQAVQDPTLLDILKDDRVFVRLVARSSGTHQLVVSCARLGTLGTSRAPGAARSTAAGRPAGLLAQDGVTDAVPGRRDMVVEVTRSLPAVNTTVPTREEDKPVRTVALVAAVFIHTVAILARLGVLAFVYIWSTQ